MAKLAAIAKGLSAVMRLKKKATRTLDAKKHAALVATKSPRIRALHNLIADTFREGGMARRARKIRAAAEGTSGGGEPDRSDPQNCPLHRVSKGGLHRTPDVNGNYPSMSPLCSRCSVGQKEAEERAKSGGGASE
jgi:hypothetical protein